MTHYLTIVILWKKHKKNQKNACKKQKVYYIISNITKILRGGAVVARQAHNLKAVGSIPAPATK